ncbi:ArsR family transcriptional regulator [Marinobacter fonticola]|uniref:ArsR family transcriptional regulator n=1 Tax=Marinobacter fonticola TaxID=2603215 RepID=UPI0011E70682|nr:transcriptional regulator [Marinobacter fonticola]
MTGPERVPAERTITIRQDILAILEEVECNASDLSKWVRLTEKDIYAHLDELKKSGRVATIPAACNACGYRFEDRRKARKPGKCPRCKSTRIDPPRFTAVS